MAISFVIDSSVKDEYGRSEKQGERSNGSSRLQQGYSGGSGVGG